jgi:hypothetical protein
MAYRHASPRRARRGPSVTAGASRPARNAPAATSRPAWPTVTPAPAIPSRPVRYNLSGVPAVTPAPAIPLRAALHGQRVTARPQGPPSRRPAVTPRPARPTVPPRRSRCNPGMAHRRACPGDPVAARPSRPAVTTLPARPTVAPAPAIPSRTVRHGRRGTPHPAWAPPRPPRRSVCGPSVNAGAQRPARKGAPHHAPPGTAHRHVPPRRSRCSPPTTAGGHAPPGVATVAPAPAILPSPPVPRGRRAATRAVAARSFRCARRGLPVTRGSARLDPHAAPVGRPSRAPCMALRSGPARHAPPGMAHRHARPGDPLAACLSPPC